MDGQRRLDKMVLIATLGSFFTPPPALEPDKPGFESWPCL